MKRILAPFCLGILAYAQPNCALTSVRCVGSGQEYATIQSAANDAAPGDTVYVLDGTYAGFNLSPGHVSGTPAGPITFQAQSPATIINSPGDSLGDGIVVNLVDYVVIRGFTISGMTRAGVNIVESVGSVVQNTSITNSGSWGILTGFAYQVQILNNTITGVAVQHGIYVSNSNRSFDGPIVRGNMVSGAAENGIQFNGDCGTPDHTGGSDGVISGAIIEGNTVFGNGQHGLQLIDTSNSIVRNNLFYGNGNTTIQTGTQAGCNFGSNNDDIVNNTIDGGINFAGLRIVQPAMGDVIWNNLIISNDHRYCVDDVTGQQCPSDGTDGSYFSGNFSVSVASA